MIFCFVFKELSGKSESQTELLDIKTKGGDSISFSFVAANVWENVNKGGKGRELMLTRGKKKQKTGER